eukprot:SAG11_NODE_6770_length_1251_cov_1.793403_1_plen_176_part_10
MRSHEHFNVVNLPIYLVLNSSRYLVHQKRQFLVCTVVPMQKNLYFLTDPSYRGVHQVRPYRWRRRIRSFLKIILNYIICIFSMGKANEKCASVNANMCPRCRLGAPQPLGHPSPRNDDFEGLIKSQLTLPSSMVTSVVTSTIITQARRPTDPTDTLLTYRLYGGKFRLWGDCVSST